MLILIGGLFLGIHHINKDSVTCGSLAGCNLISGAPHLEAINDRCIVECTPPTGHQFSRALNSPRLAITALKQRQLTENIMQQILNRSLEAAVPWLSPKIDQAEKPPIRIFATQGGGLFAAYHTAYYLATRADLKAGFTDSVFAIMSARFPVVAPPGRILARSAKEDDHLTVHQLADGGYFDNTGIDTLMEFVSDLSTQLRGRQIDMVVFRALEPELESGVKGTLSAPMTAFYNA